jgi:signal transduction histidine kinase
VLIGGTYSAVLAFLSWPRIGFDPALSSLRDLVLLLLTAAIGAALVASGFVGVMIVSDLLRPADFSVAALRYWVGDVIGIAVVAPFALIALTRTRVIEPSLETALQILVIIAALVLVFEQSIRQQFQLFYILFLPIVWIAVRSGLEGVCLGNLITQLGLIVAIQLLPRQILDVTAFQGLMIVLAITGLVAGALVTERQKTEAQLRLHKDSLAHLARLGTMGEFAAALAHEINQPLMAAGTYTRQASSALRSGTMDVAAAADQTGKAASQIERAAEVVRRLRALVRLDRSGRAPCNIEDVFRQTLDLCEPDLDRSGVNARVTVSGPLPPMMVDRLQIEQVLLNLIRNSIEAIGETGNPRGSIFLEASLAGPDHVEIRVRDTGPGFPPEFASNLFPPFSSTKADGLGIGLSLCKSIVESHGGRLWLSSLAHGAVVHFTIPTAETGKRTHG